MIERLVKMRRYTLAKRGAMSFFWIFLLNLCHAEIEAREPEQ